MFVQSKLLDAERELHEAAVLLHRDLLRLRREDPAFDADAAVVEGAVLGSQAFLLRFFLRDHGELRSGPDDRLLLVNFGADLLLNPAPEPLLAPPVGGPWQVRWSSEDRPYGGSGTPPIETEENWQIPGHAAILMAPRLP
jgi:maltooligosyltrehalose trehalohydrolase